MTDQDIVHESIVLMSSCIRVVQKALPHTDRKLIGGFFANLLDLWETGQQLDRELRKLKRFRFPQDREKLYGTLIWIDAIQVDMASYWINEVKKDGAKLRRALDRLERAERKNGIRKTSRSRSKGKGSAYMKDRGPETTLRLPPAQKVELQRRLATLDHDRTSAVTWKQLRAELARRSR